MSCYPPSNNTIQSAYFLASLCNLNLDKVGRKYIITTQDKKVSLTFRTIAEAKEAMHGDVRLVAHENKDQIESQIPVSRKGLLPPIVSKHPGLYRLGTRVFGYWSSRCIYLTVEECRNRGISTDLYFPPTNCKILASLTADQFQRDYEVLHTEVIRPIKELGATTLATSVHIRASLPQGMSETDGLALQQEIQHLTGGPIGAEEQKKIAARWKFNKYVPLPVMGHEGLFRTPSHVFCYDNGYRKYLSEEEICARLIPADNYLAPREFEWDMDIPVGGELDFIWRIQDRVVKLLIPYAEDPSFINILIKSKVPSGITDSVGRGIEETVIRLTGQPVDWESALT
jgi:hypothetical protein